MDTQISTPEQKANNTRFDRYPAIFRIAKIAAGPEPLRVLSYGCSTGEEPLTLATKYFRASQILGVDVSDDVLEKARALTAGISNVRIERADKGLIAACGLYDVIFAMSVLCRNPPPEEHRWDEFPFSRFEDRIVDFLQHLKPNGLLVLANTNYSLTQSRLIRHFDLVASPRMQDPGQVWKLAPDGSNLESPSTTVPRGRVATDCMFRRRTRPWPDRPNIPLRIVRPDRTQIVTIWLQCPKESHQEADEPRWDSTGHDPGLGA